MKIKAPPQLDILGQKLIQKPLKEVAGWEKIKSALSHWFWCSAKSP
jgi:hypothetical protein